MVQVDQLDRLLQKLVKASSRLMGDGKSNQQSVDLDDSGGAMECFAWFGNDKVATSAATKQHDGQITKSMSTPSRKNISLNPSGKSAA